MVKSINDHVEIKSEEDGNKEIPVVRELLLMLYWRIIEELKRRFVL